MIDREKVMWSLERCSCGVPDACRDCHYDNYPPRICVQHLISDALALLKTQEPPTDVSISSAIECLLHPQDADDSDMAKAIDTAVRAMRLLKAQEPRVMTTNEVGTWVMIDRVDRAPIVVEVRDRFITWIVGDEYYDLPECNLSSEFYGKTWRCWTSRPDEKVRTETPWE